MKQTAGHLLNWARQVSVKLSKRLLRCLKRNNPQITPPARTSLRLGEQITQITIG